MSGSRMPSPPPQLEPVTSPDAARASADEVTGKLGATIVRAASFAEDEHNRRVEDEWSAVESVRHLVFVLDLWLSRTILGESDPFHPMGMPPDFMPRVFPGTSIDPDARPTFEEACDALRERLDRLRGYVQGVTPEELARPSRASGKTVGDALATVFHELGAHDRFINRDLDKIEHARA